jgi:hypothetical protein
MFSRPRSRSVRRPSLRQSVALLSLGVVALASSPAWAGGSVASGGGVKGEPQPEMARFKISSTLTSGTPAVLPDGTIVLAAEPHNTANITVCAIKPGARSCTTSFTLRAGSLDGNNGALFGTVEVLATGGHNVLVAAEDCCGLPGGDEVAWASTNDGKTFGARTQVANIDGLNAATIVGSQAVLASSNSRDGFDIQAVPANGAGPVPLTYATPNTGEPTGLAIDTYKGGVLAAIDFDPGISVYYATAGSDFNATSSYRLVDSIKGADVKGLSGPWLLSAKGDTLLGSYRLQEFNGTSFGPTRTVPEQKAHDDTDATIDEVGGLVHIFYIARRDSYKVLTETTRNGAQWSALSPVTSTSVFNSQSPALTPNQAGLLFEQGGPAYVQPILNPQSVTAKLANKTVRAGHKTRLTGVVHPVEAHLTLTLQRLSGKRWFKVTTTKEKPTGKYSFTIPGVARTYRVVASDVKAFLRFGYSPSVSLRIAKTHK